MDELSSHHLEVDDLANGVGLCVEVGSGGVDFHQQIEDLHPGLVAPGHRLVGDEVVVAVGDGQFGGDRAQQGVPILRHAAAGHVDRPAEGSLVKGVGEVSDRRATRLGDLDLDSGPRAGSGTGGDGEDGAGEVVHVDVSSVGSHRGRCVAHCRHGAGHQESQDQQSLEKCSH